MPSKTILRSLLHPGWEDGWLDVFRRYRNTHRGRSNLPQTVPLCQLPDFLKDSCNGQATVGIQLRKNAITAMPGVEMRFPHTPTKGENKHRLALPAITRDWLLKHHPTAHASARLDSCIDITSRA
ncbi:hypothetical protein TNCV_2654891 [Trichonephila clavipes]|nr:hypothetical protein TNCV_2654891 [Trichonephila clavipes]